MLACLGAVQGKGVVRGRLFGGCMDVLEMAKGTILASLTKKNITTNTNSILESGVR